MAQASAARPLPRRSPLDASVDRVWRFFCSVRAAIVEIALLAVLVLIGTLRGSSAPRWLADHLPVTSGLVDRWYAWDVWKSLPFMALLTLIAVAVCICTVNRAPGIWASIARPTVTTTHGLLRNAERSARFALPADSPDPMATAEPAIRKAGYRVLAAERNGETHIYADRNRWGKLGTFPFHLGLILVLLGGVVAGRWGFRENEFIVPEGVTRPVLHDTGLSIRVDDFSEEYRETGIAKEYRSDLSILKGEEVVATGSATVNNPFAYRDMMVYQSGFGQAVRLQISDPDGNLIMDESLPLGPFRSKVNPEAPAGVIDVVPAGVQLTVIAPDTNPRSQPELDQLMLLPGQMYLQLRPLSGASDLDAPIETRVSQGETVPLGDIAVTFVREKRFTVLQVARNPGIPIFVAASLAMVGGLAMSFYFPHRRVRGILSHGPSGPVLTLAPLARRDWSGQRSFDQLVDRLEQALGVPAERIVRTDRRQPAAASSSNAAAGGASAPAAG